MGCKAGGLTIIALLSLSMFTYLDVLAYSGQVKVIGHRLSVDSAGIVHISGIVQNNSNDTVGFVHVKANLFDENGNPLPTLDTWAFLRTLPTGYISPFDIPISDQRVGKSVSFYTLSLDWKVMQPKEDKFVFSDLKIFTWTHLDPRTKQLRDPHDYAGTANQNHYSHAHSEIDAFVSNTGDITTRTVKVIVVWYDGRGQYYSYDMQTIAAQMAPMESNRFVIMTHPGMAYYSLLAESEDYVSMLTTDGEYMLRVHEANDENQNLQGVDTMSMTDLLVRDVENRVIDKISVKNKAMLHSMQSQAESAQTINIDGKEYQLQIKTYDNKLINFAYDKESKIIAITTDRIDIETIHLEITIPNTFKEFLSSNSFEARLNGALLQDEQFVVDPYSYDGSTAMHYIISSNDLEVLSQQMDKHHSNHFIFTLQPSSTDQNISLRVGEPIQFESKVINNIDRKQKFVYVLQIKDTTGVTVMISWIDGNIEPKESITATLSWTPEQEGQYTVQVSLWESLTYKSTMSSNFISSTFIVS